MKQRWILFLAFCGSTVVGPASAQAPKAHVHGAAKLQVIQDGSAVSIRLESPLDSLIGFEHAPRTAKQKQAVAQMVERLRQPQSLYALTPAAQCMPSPVQLKAPVLNLGATDKSASVKDSEHAELEAEMTFNCSTPAALKGVDVKLFDVFPGIRRLDAQVVGPRGQSATRLTPKQRRLAW